MAKPRIVGNSLAAWRCIGFRNVVTFHCLGAFAFNIGVIAFTINLLASGGG